MHQVVRGAGYDGDPNTPNGPDYVPPSGSVSIGPLGPTQSASPSTTNTDSAAGASGQSAATDPNAGWSCGGGACPDIISQGQSPAAQSTASVAGAINILNALNTAAPAADLITMYVGKLPIPRPLKLTVQTTNAIIQGASQGKDFLDAFYSDNPQDQLSGGIGVAESAAATIAPEVVVPATAYAQALGMIGGMVQNIWSSAANSWQNTLNQLAEPSGFPIYP